MDAPRHHPRASSNSSLPWVEDRVAQGVQTYVHVAYPILLLILYLAAFTRTQHPHCP